ncbi:MAG: hypothetical protein PVS3B3_18890 [Ktedonobacteraceae bacterium]
MGKVHRIKKRFWRIVSQKPLPTGSHCLAHWSIRISIGKRDDGSYYMYPSSLYNSYNGLLHQLIKEYDKSGG